MTTYRLTRRGRLLLQTFPIFLVAAVGLQAIVGRSNATPERPAAATVPAPDPTPSPAASKTTWPRPAPPTPTPRPTPTTATTGRFVVVPGASTVHGRGPLRRFAVEVEAGLSEDPQAFAAAVERVLFDERSWGGGGRLSFQRVSSGPVAFRVVLASPATTDRLCRPLETGGGLSCYQRGRSVLNAMRWRQGAASYAGDLAAYRTYLINHEVGHALGHGHRHACGQDGYAYVMIQQTKSLYGCRRNPWPLAVER